MKTILTGGTGFLGGKLIERLAKAQHETVVLTRNPSATDFTTLPSVRAVKWDARTPGAWFGEIDTADVIMNFAGESLAAKRWTRSQKEKILGSRINATRVIVESINRAKKKPSVLINASAVGYYGNVKDGDVTESSPQGSDFLAEVCAKWEEEARAAERFGTRVVILRMGVILGKDGGALEKMGLPFKMYVGGHVGSGKQWFPWIHRDDAANIALYAAQNQTISGVINVAAPDSVRMKTFCNSLGRAMHRPSWAPVPGVILKLALGEMSGMLLTGQRVVPTKLIHSGYSFLFPTLGEALSDIFS